MKQVCLVKGSVQVVEVPAPLCEPGHVLVRTVCSLISTGTELSITGSGPAGLVGRAVANPQMVRKALNKMGQIGVRQTVDFIRARESSLLPLGYSAAGEVVAVGANVRGFKIGDRVACAGAGDANHAEFNVVPQNLVALVPTDVDFESAAFTTVGAIGLHGVRRVEPTLGERVVVIGLGLLGQITVQLLRLSGCQVFGVDVRAERIGLARTLGADAVHPAGDPDLPKRVREWTGGDGADAVVLTAGSDDRALLNRTLDLCRRKGRLVLVGDVPIRINRDTLYRREIDFRISCSYGPGRYDARYERRGIDYPLAYVRWTEGRNLAEVLRLIAGGQLRVRDLIGGRRPVDEAAAAYQALRGDAPPIAMLLDYPRNASAPVRAIRTAGQPSQSGPLVLGVIGAGSFFRSMHLPNLRRHEQARVKWIATRTGASATELARRERFEFATTDPADILADPDVSAVLIATRHNLHAQQAIAALEAGKHVFVEKPLGLSAAECADVLNAVAASGRLLSVGFNRRFAPLAVKAKADLSGLREPKTILYRINAGALPADHWLRDEREGGGRLLGEAVHFFDFARWLVDAVPVSVRASAVDRRGPDRSALDDVSAVVTFADGSVATIVYSGQGASSLPKERVEILCGGRALVIDDFVRLERHGIPGGRAERLRHIDKGHAALLAHVIDAWSGRVPLSVTAEDGYWATWCAEQAAMSVRDGRDAAGGPTPR